MTAFCRIDNRKRPADLTWFFWYSCTLSFQWGGWSRWYSASFWNFSKRGSNITVIFSINHFQYQYCCWVQHHPVAMTPWNTDPCDLLTAFTVSSERYFLLQMMCLSRWRRMSGHVPSNSTCITSWIKHCVILKCGKSIKVLHELIPYSLDQFRLAAWDKVPSVSQRSMCSTSFQRRKWHSLKKNGSSHQHCNCMFGTYGTRNWPPSLKPPIWFAAGVSATTTIRAPVLAMQCHMLANSCLYESLPKLHPYQTLWCAETI